MSYFFWSSKYIAGSTPLCSASSWATWWPAGPADGSTEVLRTEDPEGAHESATPLSDATGGGLGVVEFWSWRGFRVL